MSAREMTPDEVMRAGVKALKDEVIETVAMGYLAHMLCEPPNDPEKALIGYIQKAVDLLVEQTDPNVLANAYIEAIWKKARNKALQTAKDMEIGS